MPLHASLKLTCCCPFDVAFDVANCHILCQICCCLLRLLAIPGVLLLEQASVLGVNSTVLVDTHKSDGTNPHTHSFARACAMSADHWGQTCKHTAVHACDNSGHAAVIMISVFCEGVTCVHAGCEAGEKAHTAGPTLERDDSAMEEAWVCRIICLCCLGISDCMWINKVDFTAGSTYVAY